MPTHDHTVDPFDGVAGELLGSAYNSLYGMEIVSLCIAEVYGPGPWMPSLLGDMIRAGLRGETFTLESGGDHGFQLVHVEDVAAAARLASTTTKLTQQAYFVSGGDRTTVLETAELLTRFLPDARYDIGPGHLPDWDRQVQFDLTRSTPRPRLSAGMGAGEGAAIADRMDPVRRTALTKSSKRTTTWVR
jgi:UDP-glucose 4-epimerase